MEKLLPQHEVDRGDSGGGIAATDFPRLTEIKVDVLDGADVVLGGVAPSLCISQL